MKCCPEDDKGVLLKAGSYDNANFAITGGAAGYHNDNTRWH